ALPGRPAGLSCSARPATRPRVPARRLPCRAVRGLCLARGAGRFAARPARARVGVCKVMPSRRRRSSDAAQRAVWRGEPGAARPALVGLLQQADDRGEAESYGLQRLHLCELELRAGDWAAAGHLLDEWAESAERGAVESADV